MTRRTVGRWLFLILGFALAACQGTTSDGPTSRSPDAVSEAQAIVDEVATPASLLSDDFAFMARDYENIRQALIQESLDGATRQARYMAVTAKSGISVLRRHRPEVAPEDADAVRALYGRIAEAATSLARASDQAGAREAFGRLTVPLVEWRGLVAESSLVVVRCDWPGETWLQAEGPLGNPYGGSASGCGVVTAP